MFEDQGVIGQSSRSPEENVAKVVGAISSGGFLVIIILLLLLIIIIIITC